MANIKISELNELETRHKEDLLTIVDTNNNETKKIKVETLAPENFELYAIADTQPTIPVGESYYNTTSNKIFTNVGGIYVDKGEPKKGILYIIFSDKATFAYNGTTLVSVGGSTPIGVDKIYPVGSIYMSVNSTDPATLFGGTWEQIKDTFLLSAGDTYTAGSTGGEATHTLTIDEMPAHTHDASSGTNFASKNTSSTNIEAYGSGSSSGYVMSSASSTASTGGGQAHNNMPPYLVVYVWKRIS